LSGELNYKIGEFVALYNLGSLYYDSREFFKAKSSFNQSLTVKEQIGDRQGQANIYHYLGMVAQELRDYEEARQNYQQALAISIGFNDRYSQAGTYQCLGRLGGCCRSKKISAFHGKQKSKIMSRIL